MNRLLIMAALLLASLSCSKKPVEPTTDPNTGTMVTLTASLADAVSETRVSANTDDDEAWSFAWDNDDKISGWYTGCTSVTEFVTEDHDPKTSTFKGIVESNKDYRFIYPSSVESVSGNICKIDISNQVDGDELDKTYLINDRLIQSSSLIDNTVSSLSMKHLGAIMVVDVYLENPIADKIYRLKSVKYSSKDNAINTSAEIDMTKADLNEIYQTITPGTITADMDVTFTTAADDPEYLQAITKLNILPSTLKVDQTVTIELTIEVYDKDNNVLLETLTSPVTLTNTSSNDLPFARATHNYTYLTVDGAYEAKITGATINDWGVKVDNGDLEAEKAYSYVEFKRNKPNTANMTKVDDTNAIANLLSQFRRCLMTTDGNGNATICYLDNNNSTLYNDGSAAALDGTEGDVMVYFPEYWYKYENVDDDYFRYYFSEKAEEGYIHVEASLLGAYKAYNENNMVYSRSGVTPTGNVTQANFMSYAAARGTGYQIIDYDQHCTIAMMLYAKYLDRDTQAKLGKGNADYSSTITGSTNSIGNADTDNESIAWVNGLGIEGVFGGIYECIEGVVVNNYVWTITNPTDNTTRDVTAGSSEGYITNLSLESGIYFDMVPTATSTTSSANYSDNYYTINTGRVVFRSGNNAYTNCGVAYTNARKDSSSKYLNLGSRLAFRGAITAAASVSAYQALFND